MFNLFKKKTTAVEDIDNSTMTSDYPPVVRAIHNEFFNAGDDILNEAKRCLKEFETRDYTKGKRLSLLGFHKTREAIVAKEEESKFVTKKEDADVVLYYKKRYPFNKFITKEQVKTICMKYNLVLGDVSMYKGFVPENKLTLIEKFSVKKSDTDFDLCSRSTWGGNKSKIIRDGGKSAIDYKSIYDTVKEYKPLQICAPLKDMEIPSHKHLVGYKIVDKPVPDPVVLQPVKGGFLIVCAWGDEASDEIVVNPISN